MIIKNLEDFLFGRRLWVLVALALLTACMGSFTVK